MYELKEGVQIEGVTESGKFWHTSGMTRFGGLGSVKWDGRFLLFCVVFLAGWGGGVMLDAQDKQTLQDEPVRTLHVYANLIQIPTLVLRPNRERLKVPVSEKRFSVSIDSGPWFRATHVRREGDDPISLSILLDVSGHSSELMAKMNEAIAALAPDGLHTKDHVSIYSLDCSLVQSLNDAPAESQRLKVAVNEALQTWMQPELKCEESVHLWDALTLMTAELSKLPGRRVILAVTDGHDKHSAHTWYELSRLTQATGVTVFGIRYVPSHVGTEDSRFLTWSSEDPFISVCELSGGVVLLSPPNMLDFTLHRFVTLLRERYIVEFPRPANATAGEHVKEVRISGEDFFVRPAGISIPVPDPALLADPSTVPSDPSLTPQVGKRKPMTKP
jgi:hypothetical protein